MWSLIEISTAVNKKLHCFLALATSMKLKFSEVHALHGYTFHVLRDLNISSLQMSGVVYMCISDKWNKVIWFICFYFL